MDSRIGIVAFPLCFGAHRSVGVFLFIAVHLAFDEDGRSCKAIAIEVRPTLCPACGTYLVIAATCVANSIALAVFLVRVGHKRTVVVGCRSEEHTSELQS